MIKKQIRKKSGNEREKIKPLVTHPFSKIHLIKFRTEMILAGDFNALMVQKEALERIGEDRYSLSNCDDVNEYNQKYLVGIYRSLRKLRGAQAPFFFWDRMYAALLKYESSLKG